MKEKIDKSKKFIIDNIRWILFFIALVIILFITEEVFRMDILNIDKTVYDFLSTHFISDNLTPFVKAFTNLGGAVVLAIFSTLILVFVNDKRIGISVFLNMTGQTIINFVLKNLVKRPRPSGFRLIEESGYSFPSGHSMGSAAFYGYLIYLTFKLEKNKKVKVSLISLFSALILGIGLSRIYLGVHYTSDVLAGYLVSFAYLCVFTHLISGYLKLNDKNKDGKNKTNTIEDNVTKENK